MLYCLYIISILTGLGYLYFMVLQPFCNSGWYGMLNVWSEWQTFNAGMIALLAAVITAFVAMHIDRNARNREKVKLRQEQKFNLERREREFIAARAFLPHALSSITHYAESCSKALNVALKVDRKIDRAILASMVSEKIKTADKPTGFESVFRDCIKYGNETESKLLVSLLSELQIFLSRMSAFENNEESRLNTIDMLVYSIRFNFIVSRYFEFSRFGSEVDQSPFKEEEYYTRIDTLSAEPCWGISKGDNEDLDQFIKIYSGIKDFIRSR